MTVERLRERARQLEEEASPEEIRRAQQLARAMAAERGSAWQGRTEAFDARRESPAASPDDPVIGRWFGDGAPGQGVSRQGFGEAVREAASGAERAIENQAVPPRHADLIRRVFQRYVDRLPEASSDATDAKSNQDASSGDGDSE